MFTQATSAQASGIAMAKIYMMLVAFALVSVKDVGAKPVKDTLEPGNHEAATGAVLVTKIAALEKENALLKKDNAVLKNKKWADPEACRHRCEGKCEEAYHEQCNPTSCDTSADGHNADEEWEECQLGCKDMTGDDLDHCPISPYSKAKQPN